MKPSFRLVLFALVLLNISEPIIGISLNNIYNVFKKKFDTLKYKQTVSDFKILSLWLEGEYNNNKQATKDYEKQRPTAKLGGHEFVAARIQRIYSQSKDNTVDESTDNIFLATYFFGKQSNTPESPPFRCRCYQLMNPGTNSTDFSIKMRLLKPNQETALKLKASNYNLDSKKSQQLSISLDGFEELPGCEITWRRRRSWFGERYYLGKLSSKEGIVRLQSERDPTQTILVKDELRLYKNKLWVNDRVYAADTMELLIGNSNNIPYKFNKE